MVIIVKEGVIGCKKEKKKIVAIAIERKGKDIGFHKK